MVLTSFYEVEYIARKLGVSYGNIYSVTEFQPRIYAFKELTFLFAKGGKEEVREVYKERWKEIRRWLQGLDREEKVILICNCPHTRHGREQIKQSGRFYCHTGLIGKMINRHRPDITVVLDGDRERRLLPDWKPERYISVEEAVDMERKKRRLVQKSLF